jgi:uncharacterized protein (TIGR02266 family)
VSREFASRPGRAPVELDVAVRSGRDSFVGTSKNVGIGGLFVATDRPLSIGDRLALEFTLPNHIRPTAVDAEVRWIHNVHGQLSGAGLRFLSPSVGAKVALHDFLQKTIDEDKTPSWREV